MKASMRIFIIFLAIFPSRLHSIFAQPHPDCILQNGVDAISKVSINDLKINDDTGTADQNNPTVAMNKYGYAVICWEDKRSGRPFIAVQLVDAKGLALKKNTGVPPLSGGMTQEEPDVAMDDRGHFVVVWIDNYATGDIYARRLAANATPIDSGFKVNDIDAVHYLINGERVDFHYHKPSIAMNGNGDFVICWEGSQYNWDSNLSESDIYAQRYRYDGTPQGSNFTVNSPDGRECYSPDIGMKEDGSFVIAWTDYRDNSSTSNIYARRFDSNGVALITDFLVNLDPCSDMSHSSAAVAVQEDGKFMICYAIWSGEYPVYAHLYNGDGISLIDYIEVPEFGAYSKNYAPAVCATSNGGFSIVWHSNQSGTYDIWGRNFDSAGTALGASTRINDVSGDQESPSLALDGRGAGILVWQDNRNSNLDIYGTALGPLAPLNPTAGPGFAGMVPLTWDPLYTFPNLDVYKIYRSTTSGGPYDLLATVDLSDRGVLGRRMRDYIDTDVTNGTTYYYQISAVVAGVEGPKSKAVSATPSGAGHGIVSSFAVTGTAPTIDGNLAIGEWTGAMTRNIANPYAPLPITLYVTHDNQSLYFAVDDPNDPILETDNLLGIIFDEDNNGMWDATGPSSEGLIAIRNTGSVFIGYWGTYPTSLGADASVPAAGVTSAISAASGHVQYEIAFDLTSSQLHIQPGATFGMAVMLDDPSNFYPYHYGYAAEWPLGALWEAAMPLGELTLAEAAGIPMDKNTNAAPSGYFLNQNYPNPLNPTTTIQFALPRPSKVRLEICDMMGQGVKVLFDGSQEAGIHKVSWDGKDRHNQLVPTGLYLCRLQAGEFMKTIKITAIH